MAVRHIVPILLLATSLVAAFGSPASGEKPTVLRGAGSALEGDVVSVSGSMVRLEGIDAPDPGQTCRTRHGSDYDCYTAARSQLQSMLDLGEVTCTVHATDRTQHRIGACKVLGKDLAAAMLVRGWALAYRQLSQEYGGLEARAQARKAGLWAGRVEAPWQWRTRQLNQ